MGINGVFLSAQTAPEQNVKVEIEHIQPPLFVRVLVLVPCSFFVRALLINAV